MPFFIGLNSHFNVFFGDILSAYCYLFLDKFASCTFSDDFAWCIFVSSDRSSLRDDALNRYNNNNKKTFSDHTLALHNHFTSESESGRFSLIYRD